MALIISIPSIISYIDPLLNLQIMIRKIAFILLLIVCQGYAQEDPIKIVDEEDRNRLSLYAVNQPETDYDILLTISGTGFKQRAGKPRWYYVPSASKVLVNTLIVERGKRANYTYEIQLNDSLSRRSLHKPAEAIKIKPRKQITVYLTENCVTCDTIMSSLSQGKYLFNSHTLSEKPEIKSQIAMALANTRTPLDSVQNPVISLAGKLYTEIEDYDSLLEYLLKDEE
jgi:arsenate reductase-like glutaredoxin family protein